MSFIEAIQKPTEEPKKPIILCDVGGTLLLDGVDRYGDKEYSKDPNQELITLLNHAKANAMEVRLITGGYDNRTWQYDKEKLQKTNLDPAIIANVGGKKRINADTFSNVIAIIDDDEDPYIREVVKGNPEARHFKPQNIEGLTKYLARLKFQDTGKGLPD